MKTAVCAALVALLACTSALPSAVAWADPAVATIRPGVQVTNPSGQCTSNFVFTAGANVYLGLAAHCFTLGGPTQTNGCTTPTRPTMTTGATVQGATRPARLVYSSWAAMQAAGETNAAACQYNDFALVLLDAADNGRVSPAVRRFGGPTAVGFAGFGDRVLTYGNSGIRNPVQLNPGGVYDAYNWHEGLVTGTFGGGWSYDVYTMLPGIPGDSGSGVMRANGEALGVLVTLGLDGSNGVTSLEKALDYARTHGMSGVALATSPLRNSGVLPVDI